MPYPRWGAAALRLCAALCFLTPILRSQSTTTVTTQTVAAGGGTLAFTQTLQTTVCFPNGGEGDGGTQSNYYVYSLSDFTYTAGSSSQSLSPQNSSSINYTSSPGGGNCPASGGFGTYALIGTTVQVQFTVVGSGNYSATVSQATSTISASPNPIPVSTGATLGATFLTWSAPGHTNVAVMEGSPSGTQIAAAATANHVLVTSVANNTTFYLWTQVPEPHLPAPRSRLRPRRRSS